MKELFGNLACPTPYALTTGLPGLEYPGHFRIHQAMHNGVIGVDGVQFYISNCVAYTSGSSSMTSDFLIGATRMRIDKIELT